MREGFLADARVVNGYDVDQQPAPSNTGSDAFICRSQIQHARAPLSGDHDIKESAVRSRDFLIDVKATSLDLLSIQVGRLVWGVKEKRLLGYT